MKFINTPSKIRTSSSRKKSTAMRIQKRVRGNQTHRRQQKQKKIRTIRNKFNKYKNVRSYKKKIVGGGPRLVTAADRAKQSAKAEERRLIEEERARKRAMAEAALKIKEEEAAAALAALDEARDALTRAEVEAEAEVWREMEAEASFNKNKEETAESDAEEVTKDEDLEYKDIFTLFKYTFLPKTETLNKVAKHMYKKFNNYKDQAYATKKLLEFKDFLYLCYFFKVFFDRENKIVTVLLTEFKEAYIKKQTSTYFKEFFSNFYSANKLTIEGLTLDKDEFADRLQLRLKLLDSDTLDSDTLEGDTLDSDTLDSDTLDGDTDDFYNLFTEIRSEFDGLKKSFEDLLAHYY